MSKSFELKSIELPLSALPPAGRELRAVLPTPQSLGRFNTRKLEKEKRDVALDVGKQLVRDAGAVQAYVNRTGVQSAGAITVAQITRQTAVTNQQVITDIDRVSADTVKSLASGCSGRTLETLYDTHDAEQTLQADVASGRLSPELAAHGQQVLSENAATIVNHNREMTQLAVQHVQRLTRMVFKSSRIVSADDDNADEPS